MALLPFIAAAIFLLFLQALLGRMTRVAPELGPILAVYLGLFARREWISAAAGILGLLRAGLGLEPLVSTVLILLCVAQAVAAVRGAVFAERFVTQWVVSFAAGALYLGLHAAAGFILPDLGIGGMGGLFRMTVATLSATLVAPGIYGLLRLLRVGP